MAKFTYTQYKKNFLATLISWLGGLLSTLCFGGGLCLSVLGAYNFVTKSLEEGFEMFFAGIALFLVGFVVALIFDFIAKWIDILWRKLSGKK